WYDDRRQKMAAWLDTLPVVWVMSTHRVKAIEIAGFLVKRAGWDLEIDAIPFAPSLLSVVADALQENDISDVMNRGTIAGFVEAVPPSKGHERLGEVPAMFRNLWVDRKWVEHNNVAEAEVLRERERKKSEMLRAEAHAVAGEYRLLAEAQRRSTRL